MNPQIDTYLTEGCGRCHLGGTSDCKIHNWQEELQFLRNILLETGLSEERKWGVACYTYNGKIVVLMSALKGYTALGFFKGALLKDSHKLLSKPGDNSQAVRQIRVTDIKDFIGKEDIIKSYIFQAIEVEEAGLKIDFTAKNDLQYPEELLEILNNNPDLNIAFEALTPGRKRGYVLHFNAAKQSKTRFSRIEKCIPKIMTGLGWNGR